MLQRYSAVFCGDQNQSYHGTTVQLVQPSCILSPFSNDDHQDLNDPISTGMCTDNAYECPGENSLGISSQPIQQQLITDQGCHQPALSCTTVQQNNVSVVHESENVLITDLVSQSQSQTSTYNVLKTILRDSSHIQTHGEVTTNETAAHACRYNYNLPARDSPSPRSIFEQHRRSRLSPASSPHKLGKSGPKRRRTVAVKKLFQERRPPSTSHPRNVSLNFNCFKETHDESKDRLQVKSNLFMYAIQKHACSTEGGPGKSDACVSNVRLFLDCDASHLHKQQPSHVYYMELIDEHPDTDETMTIVADDLLERFGTVQNGWVVLVGDGKTYQHLQNIKTAVRLCFRETTDFSRRLAHTKEFPACTDENILECWVKRASEIIWLQPSNLSNLVQTSREHIYFCYKCGKLCIGKW